MNESKLVVWFSYLDADGNKETWTFRQEDKEADSKFVDRINNAKEGLVKKMGYSPLSKPTMSPLPPKNAQPPSEQVIPEGTEYKPVQTEFIEVSSIALASGGDNPRFMVKGGNFTKFGVTAWKEALEEANIYEAVWAYFSQASATEELADFVPHKPLRALYSEKMHNGSSQPDKVIRFEHV